MDGLLLISMAFGILACASHFTAFMHYRRKQPEGFMCWMIRAAWFFVMMGLGVIAGILSHMGVISRQVAGSYYFFLLFNFWVAAGIGRTIAQIPDPKTRRLTAFILQAIVFLLGGFVCYCVSNAADVFLRVSLVVQGIIWLLGFWLGLKPAIDRFRFARALARRRGVISRPM